MTAETTTMGHNRVPQIDGIASNRTTKSISADTGLNSASSTPTSVSLSASASGSASSQPPPPQQPPITSQSNSVSHLDKACISTRKRSAEDFKFLECIGEGSYSKVYRAVSKKNVHTYAIKILNKQHIHKEKKRKYVTIEKNTLNLLGKHPGIVTLYYTFQDPVSLYFVIDFAQNGELLNLMHKLGSLSVELARYYTIQLIDTISFIHGKGIIHRDLKPENILLGSDWKLMITDFGAAKFVDDPVNGKVEEDATKAQETDDSTTSMGSFVGTAEYISPELLKFNQSSFASDYWSLGCIIYQMFVGIPPFKAANEYETFERIVDLIYAFPDPHKFPIPANVVNIIQKLLAEDPNERLGSDTIKQHPWFKDIHWNDETKIWGPVPKLEPYRPERYFKIKKVPVQKPIQPVQQVQQQAPPPPSPQQKVVKPASSVSSTRSAYTVNPPKTQIKRTETDYVNDRRTALKKQIMNAQNNTHLMNKVNNRINEKSKVVPKKIQSPILRTTPVLTSVPTLGNQQAPTTQTQSANPLSTLEVNNKRISNGKPISNVSSPVQKKRVNSLSSMITNNESSKSVIIKSVTTPNTTPTIPSQATFAANTNAIKVEKRGSTSTIEGKKIVRINSNVVTVKSAKTAAASPTQTHSPSIGNKSTMPSKAGYGQLPMFIQKPRVASSDATAAAGAIGTLLTHKRHLNSTSSTDTQYKQLQNHQKQLINPVLLDRQIPSIITSKLMQQETILKLDNIFKSEISHKANQFTAPGQTLNHETLENIIHKYDRDLSKDLKACVMVITSYARLFIYELNDNFRLHNPQSLTQIQALDFYQKIIEIKLTNKNVSLYDYEFDEEMHEGYLILELANVNKLVFLSAWDRSRLIKGGINSNVRVGFNVNENESWVRSFLKAKNLLKKREVATQNNLKKSDSNSTIGSNSSKALKSKNVSETLPKVHRTGSTSSMQQSFRKLKMNTHSKIRSLSQSSSKDTSPQSHISASPSMPSFSLSNSDNGEHRQSSTGSQNGSLMNGVKELALGVKAGFKGKDNVAGDGKRVKSDSTRDISDVSDDVPEEDTIELNDDQLSEILKSTTLNDDVSTLKYVPVATATVATTAKPNGHKYRQLAIKKSTTNLTSEIRERELAREKEKEVRTQNHFFIHPTKKESKAAIAAAMAVGKKR